MADKKKEPDEERREYEVSVKNYWDYNSTMKTAVLNEKKKIAQNLKAMNVMTTAQIAEATGLNAEEIEGL